MVSWVKIDGHQRPWAASRLEQGIAPPRRPRYGGVTAAPQIPTLRRRRPSGRTVIRTCLRYPCEAVPHYFVIVPRGVFRGTVRSFLQSKHGTHLFPSLLFLFFFFSVSLSLSLPRRFYNYACLVAISFTCCYVAGPLPFSSIKEFVRDFNPRLDRMCI